MDKFTTDKFTKENSTNNDFVRLEKNIVLRESAIRWMKQMEECIYICSKNNGCHIDESFQNTTHRVCKSTNPTSYNRLLRHFEDK
jgi:hypothetical protein